MNGATMALPCSLNGATSAYHAVITCDLTRSGGYQARAVWNTDGSSAYTAPSQYTQYRDLQGYTYNIPSDHQVTIGHKPILLEGTTVTVNNPMVALTSLNPSSKKAGDVGFTLTVNGSGFVNGAIVSWNGSGRARAFVNSTTMTAAISASDIATAGTAKVTVTKPAPGETRVYSGCKCTTSNYLTLTINESTPTSNNPVLTSLTPSSKKAGDVGFTLTVNGSGFVNGAIVSWNGSGRARAFVNSTTMTAEISASDIATAGTAKVTVTNPAPGETRVYSGCKCTTSNYLTLTINESTPTSNYPVLTSLTPSSKKAGDVGFTLTVNGSGFVNGAIVSWNGSGRARAFVNSTTMTAAISASDIATAGTAKVTVTNPAPGETRVYSGCKCTTSNYLSFTINP